MRKIEDEKSIDLRDVERFYTSVVEVYDEGEDYFDEHFYEVFDEELEKLDLSGRICVDVGCGMGYPSIKLAERGASVVGIDISEGMLRVARDRARSLGLRNLILVRASADHLPVKSSIADYVFALGGVINHVPDYERALEEFSRISKRGAKLIFEYENKRCLDFLWRILGAYGVRRAIDTARNISRNPALMEYEYVGKDGSRKTLRQYYFSPSTIRNLLGNLGFRIRVQRAIHWITPLLPLRIIRGRSRLRKLYHDLLCPIDRALSSLPILRDLGVTILVVAEKIS